VTHSGPKVLFKTRVAIKFVDDDDDDDDNELIYTARTAAHYSSCSSPAPRDFGIYAAARCCLHTAAPVSRTICVCHFAAGGLEPQLARVQNMQ